MRIYKNITPKQTKILRFIQNRISQEGRPPTIREIASWFGFKSTGTVRDYLKALSRKGYLKLMPRKCRALELVKKASFSIPIINRTATHKTSQFSYEEAEEYLGLEEFIFSQNNDIFGTRIKDDTLAYKGLLKGDFALIKRQSLANDGDIVAGLVNNEISLRILQKPLPKDFQILGRAIALLRKYT